MKGVKMFNKVKMSIRKEDKKPQLERLPEIIKHLYHKNRKYYNLIRNSFVGKGIIEVRKQINKMDYLEEKAFKGGTQAKVTINARKLHKVERNRKTILFYQKQINLRLIKHLTELSLKGGKDELD